MLLKIIIDWWGILKNGIEKKTHFNTHVHYYDAVVDSTIIYYTFIL